MAVIGTFHTAIDFFFYAAFRMGPFINHDYKLFIFSGLPCLALLGFNVHFLHVHFLLI